MLTLLAIGLLAYRFGVEGYLPQPIYFRPDDSLMDLYSPAYWAHTTQAYAKWRAVYPPLSFALLKLVSFGRCYGLDGVTGRACDPIPLVALIGFFLLNAGLVFASLRLADRVTALPRTIVLCAGLPSLYALERGNLLIPTFTGIVLAYGGILRGERARWAAMAWAINMKPYVIIVAFMRLSRLDWRWFAGVGSFALAIYGVSYLIYGAGTVADIVGHETQYAGIAEKRYFSDLYYATAYWPLIRILRAAPDGLRLLQAPWSGVAALGLDMALRATQIAVGVLLAMSFRWPRRIDPRRFGAMCVVLSITAFVRGSAGYTQVFLFFLLLLEPRRGGPYAVIVACVYLLSIPFDIVFLPVNQGRVFSFFGGRWVTPYFGVSVGQLVRPGLLLAIQVALVIANLRDLLDPARDRARDALPGDPDFAEDGVAARLPSR